MNTPPRLGICIMYPNIRSKSKVDLVFQLSVEALQQTSLFYIDILQQGLKYGRQTKTGPGRHYVNNEKVMFL